MSPQKTIHLISFDVPLPANYGGVIDVYGKILAFRQTNVDVILHCFTKNRASSSKLNNLCKKVYYYKRKPVLSFKLPFIVASRSNKNLLNNILQNDYPVICEGLHTTAFLNELKSKGIKVYVRTHNIEHEYYGHLALNEQNYLRKLFFNREAILLKNYETVLKKATGVFSISQQDCDYFKQLQSNSTVVYPFHLNRKITSKAGKGNYILIHGNWSVNENSSALEFLMSNVLPHINGDIVVAGKSPSRHIARQIQRLKNTKLMANPTHEQMEDLINNAHIHLLYTAQNTGIKLKLINALFAGRHCVANDLMVNETNLRNICHMANTDAQMIKTCNDLLTTPFTQNQVSQREIALLPYTNIYNINIINSLIFNS